MYTVHCTMYGVQCTLYSLYYIIFIDHIFYLSPQCHLPVQCTLYSVHCTCKLLHTDTNYILIVLLCIIKSKVIV